MDLPAMFKRVVEMMNNTSKNMTPFDYDVTQDVCPPSQTTLVGLVDYPDDEDEEDDDEEEQSPRKRPRLTS